MAKPYPLIRVCNWDRRTGKTSFCISESIREFENGNDVLYLTADERLTREISHLIGKSLAVTSVKELPAYFMFTSNKISSVLHVMSGNYFVKMAWKELASRYETFDPLKFHVFADDVEYMDVSIELLMLRLRGFNPIKVTFTSTTKLEPTFTERAQMMLKNEQDIYDSFVVQNLN